MSDSPGQGSGPNSPPKGLPSSPSIFAYQTRLLTRTSSTTNNNSGHRTTPGSTYSSNLGSLAAMAGGNSPPSTPIRRNVARMVAEGGKEGGSEWSHASNGSRPTGMEVGLGLGINARGPTHRPKGRSVDLVRGWEAKITKANDQVPNPSPTKTSVRQTTMAPPALPSSSTSSSIDSIITPSSIAVSSFDQSTASTRAQKRATVSGMDGFDISKIPAASTSNSSISETSTSAVRARPASISSYTSMLSPHSTGDSSVASARSQATEDRIAKAKANALKRREAKAAASGIPLGSARPASISGTDTSGAESADEIPTIKASPVVISPNATPVKSSPFGNLFQPPSQDDATPTRPTAAPTKPVSSRLSARNVFESPSSSSPEPATKSRYGSSGLSLGRPPVSSGLAPTAGASGASNDKYGSLSTTDRRRLGRHLPRIASGGEGWEEETGNVRVPSGHPRVPSTLGRQEAAASARDTPPSPTKPVFASVSAPSRVRATEVLAPSSAPNVPRPASPVSAPTRETKRRSVYGSQAPKPDLPSGVGINSPRPEVAGAEMKGLMNAVGAMSVRNSARDAGEGVTGMSNRLRLTKNALPPSASSRAVAPAPLPSRRLIQSNWMDRQRHDLHAYEYLCHVGEAQQWIEGCLDEELGFGVTELEEGLVDGVVLAKLAQRLQDEGVVKSIYTEGKHRYKQTENINHFLKFIRTVGMPETFIFETTDLYNRRNVPKVIFGIHVLSHLLARLGKTERIGNLVGQFEFTDEQLAATQKGLQGVAMPNFGDARNTLAKEASWEPEEPEESEDERRDRMLLECEPDIIRLQCHLRGRLATQRTARIHAQLDLAGPIIGRFQARSRGALCRRVLRAEHEERSHLHGWSTSIQAAAKAHLARKSCETRIHNIRRVERNVAGLHAQVRGVLARVRHAQVQNSIDQSSKSLVMLQAMCRGCLARRRRKETRRTLVEPQAVLAFTSLQAVLRGQLRRQAAAKEQTVIVGQTPTFLSLQSHLRGALVRRRQRAHEQKLDDATDYIVAIQATARGALARRQRQVLVQNVQRAFPSISALQAVARGRLAMKSHKTMQKALSKVEVAGSVGGLQAFLRTRLAKKQTTEQKKKLEFVQPDVIGFQAVARGYLARQEYREWRDYLQDPHTQGALVFLQSLIRGFLARRQLWYRTSFLHGNVDKVVKIQALWRGRQERLTYQKLVTGMDVDVPTVQRYMHLLDDTETDFQDQIRIESMRKEVMDLVRTNQALETEVKELDTKIALIVNNKMTFEELVRAKRRAGTAAAQDSANQFHHNVNNDPFTSGAHLDRASQRKLELYEHLFFTLQTQPQYLSRLLRAMSQDESADKDRKLVESVALILFGPERREEYLFHKLLQLSIHEEILRSVSLETLFDARFAIVPIASQYIKPSLTDYVQLALEKNVMRIVGAPELDLCTDPVELYHRSINAEESLSGLPSVRPRNLDADQVLQTDAHARAEYIQHLQELRFLCVETIKGLVKSTVQLPYTVKMMARETLLALRIKYPDAYDEDLTPIIARTVILPFILPALIAPESYGMVDQPIGPMERRNLAAVANLLTHVAAQEDPNSLNDRFVRVPLQEYIKSEGPILKDWIMDVADVEPLEGYFQAHEMLESTLEAKPISITRNEIYGTLSILIRQIPVLTNKKASDPLAAVLEELEGPPIEYDKTKIPIMLRLTNRFSDLKSGEDTRIKEDWVQAKRHVMAVLRIQTGRTLYDVLTSRPEEVDEIRWIEEVHRDIAVENARMGRSQLPPTPVEAGYQIESIRSLPFHEVKSRAIVYCIKLEKAGKISRSDAYQGLLHSIASDIRQKHHLRKMRKQNLTAMTRAHDDLRSKKAGFDEQVTSYHDYIDSSMASLQQKGKKKPKFMSKQYRHQRALAKEGKRAQFGSYTYTATDLNEKGVLLKIHDFSPRQYDKVQISLSSNEVGVFTIEMSSSVLPLTGAGAGGQDGDAAMGHEQIRMEDLLQAQFDNEQNLVLFDGLASFSINMLIHQINKKFYA